MSGIEESVNDFLEHPQDNVDCFKFGKEQIFFFCVKNSRSSLRNQCILMPNIFWATIFLRSIFLWAQTFLTVKFLFFCFAKKKLVKKDSVGPKVLTLKCLWTKILKPNIFFIHHFFGDKFSLSFSFLPLSNFHAKKDYFVRNF